MSGIKGKDENLKGLFGGSTLDRTLFRKEKKVTVKAVSSSLMREWLCLNPHFYCPLFSWHWQTKGLLICVYWSLPPFPSPVRFEAIPSALSLFENNLHLGAQERERERKKKTSTSGQWNCLVTQKGVIIEINHPILFHNWTLPWLTFQWHLPSGLSHHVHPTSVSFVCQEDSAALLVGLVWQCERHKKFPLNWQRQRLKLNDQKKTNSWCLFLVVF